MTFLLLYRALMRLILDKGHSRVPVYYEQPINIIGLVLVKLFINVIHILEFGLIVMAMETVFFCFPSAWLNLFIAFLTCLLGHHD